MILFDQFPRNMFRGHADQFATDRSALAIAKGAVEQGLSTTARPGRERGFLYMPFQHSEDLADQRARCSCSPRSATPISCATPSMHHDVIERFGRFPHRNAMLGRDAAPGGDRGRRRGALVMALVELARFYNSFEAGLARAALDAEGIESLLFDFNSSMEGASLAHPDPADGRRGRS